MNPVLEYLPPETEESFFAQAFEFPYFPTPWHYHSEYELVLVEKSHGKRFIGNSVNEFHEGDLSFLGPNLPHLYRNAQEFYENDPALRARSIVIHFSERSLGNDLLQLPQAKKLRELFQLSRQGMDILDDTRMEIIAKMKRLLELRSMERLIALLDILRRLGDSSAYRLISDPGIIGNNPRDADRLNKIFQYTMENYGREIRLEEVAALTFMTRTSFCRFFRERTKKNFFTFLILIRLSQACRLLTETDRSVSDITYCCGYNNLSNFNRQFRSKYNMSPKAYRQMYSKIVDTEMKELI